MRVQAPLPCGWSSLQPRSMNPAPGARPCGILLNAGDDCRGLSRAGRGCRQPAAFARSGDCSGPSSPVHLPSHVWPSPHAWKLVLSKSPGDLVQISRALFLNNFLIYVTIPCKLFLRSSKTVPCVFSSVRDHLAFVLQKSPPSRKPGIRSTVLPFLRASVTVPHCLLTMANAVARRV